MKKHPTAAVSKDATINTYAHLWHASRTLRRQTENKVSGWHFQIMASLVFAAFTLEAFCNHVGDYLFDSWADNERKLSPQEKLSLICKHLQLKKDDGNRPFQTVRTLLKFRNDLAHGKSVKMQQSSEVPMDERYDEFLQEELKADWQKYVSNDNLVKVHEDVGKLIRTIHEASKMEDVAFNLGDFGYSATERQ